MPRLFSYPEVQQLEVGQSCGVSASASEVKRKVALYAARANKRFRVERFGDYCRVTREPVTDTELPSVA